MRSARFYIGFVLLLVIYIYSIVFKIIPISTKIILEFVGFVYCLKYFGRDYRIKKEYLTIIRIIIFIVVWDTITCVLNGSVAFHLTKVALPLLGSIFASHALYNYSRNHIDNTDTILYLVVITIFLESVLTIFMKLFPPLYEVMSTLLVFELGDKEGIQDIYELARFYGIGNAIYFGVLPSCTLGVITSVYIIKTTDSSKRRILAAFMFVLIAIVSFFVARTAIVIVAGAALLLLIYALHDGLGKAVKISLLFTVVVLVAYYVVSSYTSENEDLEKWAFGFLMDKNVESGSAGNVIGWWENTTFDLKTLLIGDAQYVDETGRYYKHVDIGFFREIFYGGLIGLFLNLYLHYRVLRSIYRRRRNFDTKFMVLAFFACYMVILAKGDSNMVSFFILYLAFYTGGVFEKIEQRTVAIPNNNIQSDIKIGR